MCTSAMIEGNWLLTGYMLLPCLAFTHIEAHLFANRIYQHWKAPSLITGTDTWYELGLSWLVYHYSAALPIFKILTYGCPS